MPVFQSLEAFWPGLQVHAKPASVALLDIIYYLLFKSKMIVFLYS